MQLHLVSDDTTSSRLPLRPGRCRGPFSDHWGNHAVLVQVPAQDLTAVAGTGGGVHSAVGDVHGEAGGDVGDVGGGNPDITTLPDDVGHRSPPAQIVRFVDEVV